MQNEMTYLGKPVLTEDTFRFEPAQVGALVNQTVVDNAMYCLPPALWTRDLAQMGEAYSHRENPATGKWEATYTTFSRVTDDEGGIWRYCGHCFFRQAEETWNQTLKN